MLSGIYLIIGFFILIAGANFLVEGASSLAKRLHVSDLVIGLSVVAFGTSTPELFVNIFASMQGNAAIAIGNILGSNIFNILVIVGAASLINPLSVTKGTVWKEIPFSLLAAIILGAMANDVLFDKMRYSLLTRIDGFILISFFVIFIYYLFSIAKDMGMNQQTDIKQMSLVKSLGMVGGGIVGLACGGELVQSSAVNIASSLGVSQSLIGLTIVAAGTSLPELATSAVAAFKKNSEIAVGNIIGSNIFNIFFVLGISALIKPLPVTAQINADILVLLLSSIFLFLFMFTGKRRIIDRWEGAVFIALYIGYIIFLIKRG
ncbi:MAG: calcium/sodium antiporter [Candidatus Omnitrophota bacterium]